MEVLLAEDSGVMRKIIMRGLHQLGIPEVVEAEDGKVAFEKFQDGKGFSAILTDWNMPNMTGIELVRAVRATGSKVPIMMITTEAEKAKVIEAIGAGCNDYMIKPFDNEMLLMKLERVLHQLAS